MLTIKDEINLEAEGKRMAMEHVKEAMQKNMNNGATTTTTVGKAVMNGIYADFVKAIKVFVDKELAPKAGVMAVYNPLIVNIRDIYTDDTEMYALYTMSTLTCVLNSVFKKETHMTNIANNIGNALEDEAHIQAYLSSKPNNEKEFFVGMNRRSGIHYKSYYAFKKAMPEAGFQWTPWNTEAKVKLGGKLLELLIQSTRWFEMYTDIENGKNSLEKIIPTQDFIAMWNANEYTFLQNVHQNIPMIIPPKPWTSFEDGGYYGCLAPYAKLLRLSRNKSVFQYNYMRKLKQTDLTNVFRAINAVQATPWQINRKVLSVLDEIIKCGGGVGGIPLMQPLPELPRLEGDYTPEELKAHKKKCVERVHAELSRKAKALRCLSMIAVAHKYAKYEDIYFPCNMDFRGRVYPIPSFSFQGDDLTKGLLLLQHTPPATDEQAEYWFRIAGCEFYGNDKVSFSDQITWTHDNERQILSVASDPLGVDKQFWADSDCPVEFLGWCFEYADMITYKKAHNNSVVGWVCGVPVAFDGTCSGLQHFSAALRDEIGGKEVNLIPAEKPRDIYGVVANKVTEMLHKDAVNGDEDKTEVKDGKTIIKYGTKSMSQMWLAYGVTRKVTKRCVMTLAYGSKQYGFKNQIIEDTLKPARENGKGDMFVAGNNALANYLAKLIWKAVTVTVVKAAEGMKWLQDIASIVCKEGNVVTWTTPMGLLVQQNYMEMDVKTFQMRLLGVKKRFYAPYMTDQIAARKQAQGIAPNFIHSMDASHLQWSINKCLDKGIHHYSMIHDSYATCPAQADTLFHCVREAFVEMYTSNDVLMNFKADMEMLVPENVKLPDPPSKGLLDINCVLDSLYVFH